jgi:pimeloyl-ACP methyl ester carboxylesterase
MRERTLETPKGIRFRLLEAVEPAAAGAGKPLVYFHSAGGLLPFEPLLETLAAQGYQVYAPVWPGYGEESGEDRIEDMLDFALHGWDTVDLLGLTERPILVGHSMGGMIAAEMACLQPQRVERLVLIASAGLWLDEHPIPDLFSMLPFELAQVLFHDPKMGEAMLTGGVDFNDFEALKDFLVVNARRLGTAAKILFPIPNRRLSKRLYRMTAPTLLVWGKQDKLIPPPYAERFQKLLPHPSRIAWIDQAGHMVPYEQTQAVAEAIVGFLARSASAA